MKLTILIATVNQLEVTKAAVKHALDNLDAPHETELILIDNGSDETIGLEQFEGHCSLMSVVRNEGNSGNYPVFFQGRDIAKGELVAFLHNDVFVLERGWDRRVREQFDSRPELGLLGFIGSTEIDNWGGRGMGTVSNMKAVEWHGKQESSEAHIHGAQSAGMTVDGSVVDGCVMIFRKSVLEQIPFREDLTPHHFYDRVFSCQVIELGYKVGILGVEFAHLSGMVANREPKWIATSAAWFKLHYGIDEPQEWARIHEGWVKAGNSPSRGKVPDQWDYAAYLENERVFLQEYRDQKHLVPLRFGKRI